MNLDFAFIASSRSIPCGCMIIGIFNWLDTYINNMCIGLQSPCMCIMSGLLLTKKFCISDLCLFKSLKIFICFIFLYDCLDILFIYGIIILDSLLI